MHLKIDLGTRVVLNVLQAIEDEQAMKQFHAFVPKLLPAFYAAFTCGETDAHGRAQILEAFYLSLRTISWADGIDNDLVGACLDEQFNTWMALFQQLIQTNAKSFFEIKKNALKCLTVVFRDFINYSRDCISKILEPAWKLLNFHLPVFTEVLGYGQSLREFKGPEDAEADEPEPGFESDDEEEVYGVEGMTLQLIELLATLICRQNVQEVVRTGIVPLVSTVSSYMIVPRRKERQHVGNYQHFLADADDALWVQPSVRKSCRDLLSSLIEVFGDLAVQSVLFVVENLFLTASSEQASPAKVRIAQTVEEINIYDYSFSSGDKKHAWKKREVALFLIGSFAEDISMFRQRNPGYNFKVLLEEMMLTDFAKCPLRSYLKGRTLQCAAQMAEVIPRDYEELHKRVLQMAVRALQEEPLCSVKLVATSCLVKYARKLKPEAATAVVQPEFAQVLDQLTGLLENSGLIAAVYLPIEAFTQYSRYNEEIVAQMAPKVTPKLLTLFRHYHSEGALASELLNLFKIWCNYAAVRDIFVNAFLPFIMEIVDNYYQSTANVENKDQVLQLQSTAEADRAEPRPQTIVDSAILAHVLDLLCTLLRKTKDKQAPAFARVVEVFPRLLAYVHKSEDMFLLLHGTAALKTFVHLGHEQILKVSAPKEVIETAKRLLNPLTNEQAALCLGNFVIQIFHKIQPKVDTDLLYQVVRKLYKTRMPSIVQSLVLIFARLIHQHPKEIVELLTETSIENRISLKIVLDKWLLQQPLFRGYYTKNATFSALLRLFTLRDARIESLMVIGYNPSHSNVNSEVNAPFKILSLALRFLDNELSPKKGKRPPQAREDEEEEKTGSLLTPGYKLKREMLGEGERLDTVEGDDDDANEEAEGTDKIEVNLDDVDDEDDNESLLGQRHDLLGGGLFQVKESTDRGLADMETGSEVYMSELLAGFDMEDFDEAEEQNEEDLLELGDAFGSVNLRTYIPEQLLDFAKSDKGGAEYLAYCVRQLLPEDQDLAKKYLKLK